MLNCRKPIFSLLAGCCLIMLSEGERSNLISLPIEIALKHLHVVADGEQHGVLGSLVRNGVFAEAEFGLGWANGLAQLRCLVRQVKAKGLRSP